jgi:hypothetical protein
VIYRVFQNWRIPNSERGRERPSGALKYLEKKLALREEDISTLILFTVTKYYPSYVAVSLLRQITNILDFFTPK